MKNFFRYAISFVALALMSCATATVSLPDICKTSPVGTIPAAPSALTTAVSGITLPPLTFSTKADLSDSISKIGDVSDGVSVVITELLLTGDSSLQWIRQVDVSLQGDTPDLPVAALATYTSTGVDTMTVSLQVKMNSDMALRYLKHPVNIIFTVSGMVPTTAVSLTNTMCVDATGQFSKSL